MKRRRERESAALAVAAQWAQVAESAQAAGRPPRATPDDDPNDDLEPSEPVVIPALPGMPGGLAGMLAQAMGAGGLTVAPQDTKLSLENSQHLREEILEALREHGVQAERGQTVEIDDPELISEIFGKLSEQGVAPEGDEGMPPSPADQVSQLERLGKLRDSGVLTDSEFAEQKRRILEG